MYMERTNVVFHFSIIFRKPEKLSAGDQSAKGQGLQDELGGGRVHDMPSQHLGRHAFSSSDLGHR
jgi:hypothetical protein